MKKEQKNVSLATEIIGDLQDVVSTTLSEIEALTLDLDMAEFILNELLELTDKEPENELEALRFALHFLIIFFLPDCDFQII